MKKNSLLKPLLFLSAFLPGYTFAGDVEIVNVELEKRYGSWQANVTLKHGDTGWEHYADAWRLVDKDGNEIGKRTLWHPHVNEQPFTRSLSNFHIPANTSVIYVEAHDKKHGWAKDRVEINLKKKSGNRYKIR